MWTVLIRVVSTVLVHTRSVTKFEGRNETRRICLFQSSERRRIGGARIVSQTHALANQCPTEPIFGQVEMDSHADTSVLGKNFVILSSTGRECDVYPYTDSYDGIKGVQIVSGATSWTCQDTGETFILVVHEALWMPNSLAHSLVNPNQLRAFGTTIQDNPFGGPMSLEDPEEIVRVPLQLNGTNIGFTTRTPSQEELDGCQHLHLSSQHEWDPANLTVPKFELSALGRAVDRSDSYDDHNREEIYHPDHFSRRLVASCRVHTIPKARKVQEVLTDVKGPPTFVTEDRRADVSPPVPGRPLDDWPRTGEVDAEVDNTTVSEIGPSTNRPAIQGRPHLSTAPTSRGVVYRYGVRFGKVERWQHLRTNIRKWCILCDLLPNGLEEKGWR